MNKISYTLQYVACIFLQSTKRIWRYPRVDQKGLNFQNADTIIGLAKTNHDNYN